MASIGDLYCYNDLKALLWKNFRLRKHHYVITIIEFLLPIISYILLFKIKESMVIGGSRRIENATIFRVKTKDTIILEPYKDENISLDLLFTPNTTFTEKLMSNVLSEFQRIGVKLGTYRGFQNETIVNNWFESKYGNHTTSIIDQKGYGVLFEKIPLNGSIPNGLRYKIRSVKNEIWNTDLLFPVFQKNGPMEAGDVYFLEGFIGLQILIDFSFISIVSGEDPNDFGMEEFPYPSYEDNSKFEADFFFSSFIPFLTIYGAILMGPILINKVVEEKKCGAQEYMKMVGLKSCLIWFSWVVFELMAYLWISIILTVILKISINGTIVMMYINPVLLWVILLMFFLSSTFFFLVVASLFENPMVASSFGLLFVVSYHLLSGIIQGGKLNFAMSFLSAIHPGASFLWISKTIGGYETMKKELGFSNMFQMSSGEYHGMTVGIALLCNLLEIILSIFIIFYVSAVKPGQFGRAKPWHFIFQPLIQIFAKKYETARAETSLLNKEKSVIEEVPEEMKVGLSIINLHKEFRNVIAVNHLSLDIYHNQITALLGHNGAGKTTLLSIITGLFSPSEGDVQKDGKSIFGDLNKFRKDVGLCPQENLLFSYLTVSEHITFFAMLKGISIKEAKDEELRLFSKMGLTGKENELVQNLSGGMKRKLSLAISLIGNSKILILDEPTSGMDPESRREIWDILLTLRENRTVIITTHFMEEADVLGDRIAIIDHGEIKCYGSSLFLKQHYGTGYHLKLIMNDASKKEAITSLIKDFIPKAIMKNFTHSVVTFILPTEEVAKFPDLFSKLETNSSLQISGMGLACTTMEDVFLRVAEEGLESAQQIQQDPEETNKDTIVDSIERSREALGLIPATMTQFSLFMQRCSALLKKKFICTYRHWFASLFFVIVYPIIITSPTISTQYHVLEGDTLSPPLLLNLKLYGDTDVLVSGNETSQNFKTFSSLIYNQGSHSIIATPNQSIIDGLLEFGRKHEGKFRTSFILAADLPNNTILYSSIAIHAPPIAVNTFSNFILSRNPISSKYWIETFNHPYNFITGLCIQNFSFVSVISSATWTFMLPMAFIFSIGYSINMLHKERVSSSKQLQIMTGLSALTYWLSNFIWDFLQFTISAIMIIMTLVALDKYNIFTSFEEMGVLLLCIFLMSGGAIMLVYLFSFFLNTNDNAYTSYVIISIMFGTLPSVIINMLTDFFPNIDKWQYFFMLNPYFAFSSCLYKIVPKAIFKSRCRQCTNPDIQAQCAELRNNYFQYFKWDKTGINTELTYLSLDYLLYGSLIYAIESGYFASLWNYFLSYWVGQVDYNSQMEDADVTQEKDEVDNVIMQGSQSRSALVVSDLGKKFTRKVTAVHGVNFIVAKGECFGLLGVNGAGKTTTFRMLTGDLFPSKGESTIFGCSLLKKKHEYLSQIGYCPQVNGIVEELSGFEVLCLYASLRGLRPSEVFSAAHSWISLLGLERFSHRPCKTYSGGNKRKLCTALALIGDPPFVFLDEPTTGVDPLSRRKLWNVLLQRRKQGQTVIITSHSMEECEALCDRLTIMVKGQMQCIGTVQHLKQIYGQGFTIRIKLATAVDEELKSLKAAVISVFSNKCILKDEHSGLLHYHLNDPSYKWSILFEEMQKLKDMHSIMEDYIISETTLEQVFLSFARKEN